MNWAGDILKNENRRFHLNGKQSSEPFDALSTHLYLLRRHFQLVLCREVDTASTVNSQQGDVNQHWAWSPGADICIGLCCPPIFRELEGVAVCYKARWYDLPLNIMSHVTPQQYSLLQTFYILQGNRGDKLSGVEWKSSKLECARSRSGNAYLCEIWFQR